LFLCGFLVVITVAHVTLLYAANLGPRTPAAATTGKPASTGRALGWLVDYFSLCSRTDQPLTDRTKDLHTQKTLFVSSASLALATADLLTFWPVWRFISSWTHDFDLPEQAWYGFLVLATVLATGFAMWAAIYLFIKGKLWRAGTRTVVISGLLFAAVLLFCWRGLQNGAHQADFFFFRSLEIESGVSPIVPYILLLAGIYAACWAHTRRHFHKALEADRTRMSAVLVMIAQLYAVEKTARRGGLRGENLRLAREHGSRPVLDRLHQYLAKIQVEVLPKSAAGQAVAYALKNWKALTRFCSDGDLSIDNNATERTLRSLAVGRNNWTFFGSDNGGKTAAVLRSFITSCELVKIDPFVWFRDVLSRIPDHLVNKLDNLLPHNWAPAKS